MIRSTLLRRSIVTPCRYKSTKVNFHRPDGPGSKDAAEQADATATILADSLDFQKRIRPSESAPNKLTWLDALNEKKRQLSEGKTISSFAYQSTKTTAVGEKTRSESFSYLTLPFKDDVWLRDSYINAAGRLRVGQLFQDLDALAGRIAYRHCAPAEPVNVTASVDRIYIVKKVDDIENYNFVLTGVVTWTGRSSMEISVKGYAFPGDYPSEIKETNLSDDAVFLKADFTFVARNPETHKSFPINHLLPTNEREWLDFRRAESHNAQKKLRAKLETLDKVPPTQQESNLIHNLYIASKAVAKLDPEQSSKLIFMKDSQVSSTLFMQPQYRNRHSYMIFGGYLLRQTFELAYCAAGAFSCAPPRFVSLDSTTFKAPVPVGAVLFMNARVCYTEHIKEEGEGDSIPVLASLLKAYELPPANQISHDSSEFLSRPGTIIQVKVDTKIRNLDSVEAIESGSFIYSFFVPRDTEGVRDKPGYCSVVPQTYEEMMLYIEGRRRAFDTAEYAKALHEAKKA
ncbi:hypothetical protein PP7435_CHR2-0578 [Komagataella phaffii CBS 7435]|uniref:HotDog ACOT-type domain-containing protein n=2 Tax=Komagataella phaffii TaxID=460519 RepID=C4R1H5_KOMPG|nr:Hypothetical protein PAS_chr2-1_0701 [Komagataella phaffii GS115]AOA61910.1 GQ67_00768T0 [Komagataella phaffii]CAH2448120.1 hypothetical protein BQ9382_C2-3140 [Komagataella phaffii CBS 7435]AOA67014.1 GQ68_00621T0 [Komagataella phaffii GS115]CAY69349.1 Hypothetical protein PAS_chr2-1_0701 [Komagataella phaffii GS115]CCA38265.1 hypothetical protein PP7435_CHR2-0578 [Komagataella phaffii CBS 7435]